MSDRSAVEGLGANVGDRSAPATIRDVATRAGVSTATVSRVLAGIGHARPETTAAVLTAAKQLDYRPSGVARSLRMRRTRTLGLIVTDIQNPFFPELVQAADDAARAIGSSILLGSAAYDEHRAEHYMRLMVDQRVDGIIIASSQLSPTSAAWLLSAPVPAVAVNSDPGELRIPVIASDNEGGTREAVEHLVGLGHRRIAYIRGAPDFTATLPRYAGFRQGMAAAGIPDEDSPAFAGEGQVESGERAAAEIIRTRPDVTAIVCYNDLTAMGVLRALRAAGRRVPGDVSVVGCDDIAAAGWVAPTLTTMAQQKTEMGRLAVETLAAAIERQPSPGTIRLPMILRARESSGPAPDAASGG
jgi:DNA-binding LacI/PurR family transcriptional regulator